MALLLSHIASHPMWFLGLVACVVLVVKLRGPSREPREPPVIRAGIPVVGHVLGLLRWENEYLWRLYKQKPMSIATLPMIGRKIYVIWEPQMIQSAMRSRNLDFGPFALSSARLMLGLDADSFRAIATSQRIIDGTNEITHKSLAGPQLHRVNARALNHLFGQLDAPTCPGAGSGDNKASNTTVALEADNLYLWLRNVVTTATVHAIYGDKNPWGWDPSLVDDLWTLEASLGPLVLGAPRIFLPRVYDARDRLHAGLLAYYEACLDKDPSAGAVVRERANILRQEGVSTRGIAQLELSLALVGTSNTAPSMYWLITSVCSRPELARELTAEAWRVVHMSKDDGRSVAAVKVEDIETACPRLVSCYRETIRATSRVVGHRQILTDMMMSDSAGTEYLLKAGTMVQLAVTATHRMESVWGPDALEFRPDRFFGPSETSSSSSRKQQRDAYVPFGGGRHLCPGRNLAFAEHLGLMVALLAGFEVTVVGAGQLETSLPRMGTAVMKPVGDGVGQGVRIVRKKGWEGVRWRFYSGEAEGAEGGEGV